MLTPFIVQQSDVASIRRKIIAACVALLSHADKCRALAAARTLGNALRAPHGLLGATVPKSMMAAWEVEFAETFKAINAELDRVDVAPVVLVKLAMSTGWYSRYGTGELKKL